MSETTTPALQYRCDGPDDAPVLVLGPSLGTTWHMWDRQIPELSSEWRVLRYDLPGHGGAPAHPADSVPELAARLLVTLDGLGVQRFGYVGCALGGAVGAELALRHPHRVASLALISSSPRFGTADEYRQRGVVVRAKGLDPIARTAPEQWFTPGFAAQQPAITEWAVQMVRTTDPGCYIAACEALATFDLREDLVGITVPTLVLVGSEDQVTGPGQARTLVAGIHDARLALVPGASHLAPVEQPGAVTDLLVRHFSGSWAPADPGTAHIAIPAVLTTPVPPQAPTVPVGPSTPLGQTAPAAPASPIAPPAPALVEPSAPAPRAVPAAEIAPMAETQVITAEDTHARGLRVRRDVLGDAHVDREIATADEFTDALQDFGTRYEFGEVWQRPGLDRRLRSAVALTALTAGGHFEELAAHTRAALRGGLSPQEVKEVLLQTAVHCGLPAARRAFAVAQAVIAEETTPQD
ncbi:alpha/beta fold hydrolase [Streptomyces sp. NPDC050560]|uniref:bifunctional 3-oxoadipate enol-lactonase/4-carboxymuconolactone decarboxylase PcaDC n=1 Tax=Streptomyces sp. NPDC050560 TaxID=3365630 RepID=UPI0037875622